MRHTLLSCALLLAAVAVLTSASVAEHHPRRGHPLYRRHGATDRERDELAKSILNHHQELREEERAHPERYNDVDAASAVPTNGRLRHSRHAHEKQGRRHSRVRGYETVKAGIRAPPTNGDHGKAHRGVSREDYADMPGSRELAQDADKALKVDIARKLGIKGVAGAVNNELHKDTELVRRMAVEDAVRAALHTNKQDDANLDRDLNRDASKLHADLENTIVQAEERRGASWKKIANIGTKLDKGWKGVKHDVQSLHPSRHREQSHHHHHHHHHSGNSDYGDGDMSPEAEGEQEGAEGEGEAPGATRMNEEDKPPMDIAGPDGVKDQPGPEYDQGVGSGDSFGPPAAQSNTSQGEAEGNAAPEGDEGAGPEGAEAEGEGEADAGPDADTMHGM